ncbi:MAG: hypothetical protein BWY38_03260 [Ignavibacteria bacterium ADurb.Bin266]|nr:MAG: hypothetical protein BWY38_03260 [Ignavibacteria bacterium ADurb.Bin266]
MSQKNKILEHLKSGQTITPKQAYLWFGCLRLGARIYDFRKMGYDIKDISHEKYSEYKMELK